jgi:tRNA 2-thiocytidine biosynthesis protein TtcA
MKKILRNIGLADYHYNLIEEGDIVAVGVSGGKDSCLLLLALDEYRKKSFKNFEIIGIHLEMGFEGMDFSGLNQYMDAQTIKLVHVETKIFETLKKEAKEDGSLKCSLCSKFKKALVIREAKKLGCTKVAFAHHAEDALETLFLNAIHGGKLSTFLPKMHMSQSDMTFIRPFVYVHEDEIRNEVKRLNLPFVQSTCPMDGHTQRMESKRLVLDIYDRFPAAKKNLINALHNDEQLKFWVHENKSENLKQKG